MTDDTHHRVYWHRDLPPADSEIIGDHVVEAASHHVNGALDRGHARWGECHDALIAAANACIEQEVLRLGGCCGHVIREHIEPKHNERVGESWLYGRFEYVLLRSPDSQALQ